MENVTGIILAAGLGSRLGNITAKTPKAIVRVVDKPLIAYAINFAKAIGVERIVVVGGFQFQVLKKTVLNIDSSIEVYENRGYDKGNLYTLKVALEKINGSFLLFHVDHIYHKDIAKKVCEQCNDGIIAFTDTDRKLEKDDMKIRTDKTGTILKKVSKRLIKYNAGYVGLTYCNKNQLEVYKRAVFDAEVRFGNNAVTEHAMQIIADRADSKVFIGDISGYGWFEIDNSYELVIAEKIIQKDLDGFNFF